MLMVGGIWKRSWPIWRKAKLISLCCGLLDRQNWDVYRTVCFGRHVFNDKERDNPDLGGWLWTGAISEVKTLCILNWNFCTQVMQIYLKIVYRSETRRQMIEHGTSEIQLSFGCVEMFLSIYRCRIQTNLFGARIRPRSHNTFEV